MYASRSLTRASLNRHLARTYNFGNGIECTEARRVVEVPRCRRRRDKTERSGFRNGRTPRQYCRDLFNDVKNKDVEDIVILAGDHLYRMDYMKFVEYHRETNADITVGTLPIEEERASDFRSMKIDPTARIVEFTEKPKGVRAQGDGSGHHHLGIESGGGRG